MPDADPVPLTGDTVVPVVEGGAARSSESADEPVQHVSIKPPAFMESAVQGWFAIMQAPVSSLEDNQQHHQILPCPGRPASHHCFQAGHSGAVFQRLRDPEDCSVCPV